MAFAETRLDNREVRGDCGIKIVVSETGIVAGDCLGVSGGTWVLSAHTTGEQPLLIAGNAATTGDTITAYPMGIVKVVTTATNVSTVGEKVGYADTGFYEADSAGVDPDVGHVASIGSDSLSATMFLLPLGPQLTTTRA